MIVMVIGLDIWGILLGDFSVGIKFLGGVLFVLIIFDYSFIVDKCLFSLFRFD